MRVVQVPVLNDNYSYLLIDDATKQAAAVDPQEPEKSVAVLAGVLSFLTLLLFHLQSSSCCPEGGRYCYQGMVAWVL